MRTEPRTKAVSRSLALVLALCLPAAARAQEGTRPERAAALVRDLMARTGAPGMAVSVGVGDRIVWSEGFGYADVEQRVPVWPAITRFRIGSVSKTLTSVAVGQLYEQGRLDLDAPVQRYVPSFPEKRKGTVTTRLLAGHLAGIRHYRDEEFLRYEHYDSVLDGLAIFADDTLLFAPGTKYSYSTYGWDLISAVVQGASGEDYLSYMREHVFEPIGMSHTAADHVDSIVVNRTRYYEVKDGTLLNAPAVDNSYKWAGGGFLSTSEDLVRFGFAQLDHQVLKPETVRLLWTPQKTSSGEETGYGMGWRVGVDGGHRWVGHGGGSVGGTTYLRIYPDSRVVIVLIANLTGLRFGNTPRKLARLFLPE
ncbi:MAG: serine hydrolase domain-containing protein [Gemmatimonadota bacterium]